jgi:serine/threonine protein kinase
VRKLILSGITLGKGQYGVVQFACDQIDPSEVFAVKVIDRKKLTTPQALKNLQNEIAIMTEIRSPYVVALKDATKTENNFYLAMELCNGGDLSGLS